MQGTEARTARPSLAAIAAAEMPGSFITWPGDPDARRSTEERRDRRRNGHPVLLAAAAALAIAILVWTAMRITTSGMAAAAIVAAAAWLAAFALAGSGLAETLLAPRHRKSKHGADPDRVYAFGNGEIVRYAREADAIVRTRITPPGPGTLKALVDGTCVDLDTGVSEGVVRGLFWSLPLMEALAPFEPVVEAVQAYGHTAGAGRFEDYTGEIGLLSNGASDKVRP